MYIPVRDWPRPSILERTLAAGGYGLGTLDRGARSHLSRKGVEVILRFRQRQLTKIPVTLKILGSGRLKGQQKPANGTLQRECAQIRQPFRRVMARYFSMYRKAIQQENSNVCGSRP